MKNNVIFGMGIFFTADGLRVLGQAKTNVRQMSREDSFGCVIFKILWDNGAKTQLRQNTELPRFDLVFVREKKELYKYHFQNNFGHCTYIQQIDFTVNVVKKNYLYMYLKPCRSANLQIVFLDK